MAGYMYLGNKKVCPALLMGGKKPTEYLTIRFQDGVMDSSNLIQQLNVRSNNGVIFDIGGCTKFDSSAYFYDLFTYSYTPQENFIFLAGDLKEIASDIQGFCCNLNFKSGHTDIYFDNLEKITSYFFGDVFKDTNITSLHLPKMYDCKNTFFQSVNCGHLYLDSANSTTFTGGYGGISSLFSGLSNQTIHLPSNMSSVMPSISGYPNFGGTNTTILYDLPATE